MTHHLEENKQSYIKDFITSNYGETYDSLLFASNCEIVYDFDKKESKRIKWKYSKRIIALTRFKIISFKKNFFGKGISVDKEFNLLDLIEISSGPDKDSALFDFNISSITIKVDHWKDYVKKAYDAVLRITHGRNECYQTKISIPNISLSPDSTHPGFANGFEDSYYAHCNYRKTIPIEDIVLYIEDLFNQNIRELNLKYCPGIDHGSDISADLISIGSALSYNTYFNSLILSDIPHKEALSFAAAILKYNRTLTKIIVRNTGSDCSNELGNVFLENSMNNIQIIDFSGNTWGSSAMLSFSSCIRQFNHHLSVLSLSNCNISSKSLIALFHSFKINWGLSIGLKAFDISHNKFDDTSLKAFNEWIDLMKDYSNLERLGLSNCNIDLSEVLKTIMKCKKLQFLDISRNNMNHISLKHIDDIIPISNRFKILNIASTNIDFDVLDALLDRLFDNKSLKELYINISDNSIGLKNASSLGETLKKGTSLRGLDISNNNLCGGCEDIICNLRENLRFLILDGNFNCLTQSSNINIDSSLSKLMDTHPNIKYLSICGIKSRSKSKEPILFRFFESLSSNQTLEYLNISDSAMKDAIFSKLCKELRSNNKLKSLLCDGNNLTISGHQALLRTVIINKTLSTWSFPFKDIEKAGNEARHQNICLEITRHMNLNGEQFEFKNPFTFYREWDVPKGPAKRLDEVPDELKTQTFSNDIENYLEDLLDTPNSSSLQENYNQIVDIPRSISPFGQKRDSSRSISSSSLNLIDESPRDHAIMDYDTDSSKKKKKKKNKKEHA